MKITRLHQHSMFFNKKRVRPMIDDVEKIGFSYIASITKPSFVMMPNIRESGFTEANAWPKKNQERTIIDCATSQEDTMKRFPKRRNLLVCLLACLLAYLLLPGLLFACFSACVFACMLACLPIASLLFACLFADCLLACLLLACLFANCLLAYLLACLLAC